MPHFVIDCSERIIEMHDPEVIMQHVFETALATNIFDKKNIKVRINTFKHYNTAGGKDEFIHVFGNIMSGRTVVQKQQLSKEIVSKLKEMFSEVTVISMNVVDFEKATYCNRAMV